MKLLLDANIPKQADIALMEAGHDVLAVHDLFPDVADDDIVSFARTTGRIVITQDHDFPDMAFRDLRQMRGLILVRMPDNTPEEIIERLPIVLKEHGDQIEGHIVVVEPDRVRITPLPNPVPE